MPLPGRCRYQADAATRPVPAAQPTTGSRSCRDPHEVSLGLVAPKVGVGVAGTAHGHGRLDPRSRDLGERHSDDDDQRLQHGAGVVQEPCSHCGHYILGSSPCSATVYQAAPLETTVRMTGLPTVYGRVGALETGPDDAPF